MAQYPTALITDSTCDIPDPMLKQYDIHVVPMRVIWGREDLRDRIDIQPGEFYERLTTDPTHPTTSQPAPSAFIEMVQKAQAAGAKEAVILTVSSQMSSTYNSAMLAQQEIDIPVHIIDSKANSMSLGWQVLAAARAREAGGDAQSMIAAADRVRSNLVTLLYVDTLEYLHKGGRISAAARLVGTALNFKPLLAVNHETGLVEPKSRTRTRKKALDKMLETFFAELDTSKPLRVTVLHGNVLQEAQKIAQYIREKYNPVEMFIEMTSPVMGVHTGPGAIALCGYSGE